MTVRPEVRGPAEDGRPLAAGAVAPDFVLHCTPDQTVALSDFLGQPVILVFYLADWNLVCADQLALYQELLPEFRRFSAQVLGISVDGIWCHLAFARELNLEFPLLADFQPKGAVAAQYHVYRQTGGLSERALFVVDGQGMIRWSYLCPADINPGADGILTALESL